MQQISGQLSLLNFQPPTAGPLDSLASLFRAVADAAALKICEELLSLRYSGSLQYENPKFFSAKTSKGSSPSAEDACLGESLMPWGNWGISANGSSLTAQLTYPKTDPAYILLDIMVDIPPERFFLSSHRTRNLALFKREC